MVTSVRNAVRAPRKKASRRSRGRGSRGPRRRIRGGSRRYIRPTRAGATIIGSMRIAISHGRASRSGARKIARPRPRSTWTVATMIPKRKENHAAAQNSGSATAFLIVAEADDFRGAERLEADLRDGIDEVEDQREAEEEEQEDGHRREQPDPVPPSLRYLHSPAFTSRNRAPPQAAPGASGLTASAARSCRRRSRRARRRATSHRTNRR